MKLTRFISAMAIAVIFCITAFAALPAVPPDHGSAAVDIQKTSPASAAITGDQSINHFAVADRAAITMEVLGSPPDIAIAAADTTTIPAGSIITSVHSVHSSPPGHTIQRLDNWTPNIGYIARKLSVPPEYQTARSGSLN